MEGRCRNDFISAEARAFATLRTVCFGRMTHVSSKHPAHPTLGTPGVADETVCFRRMHHASQHRYAQLTLARRCAFSKGALPSDASRS
jgi:hypothetical protein